MKQVKLFRTGFTERDINSWIEVMSNDPTFRVIDIKLARGQSSPITLVIYEIESEKEKEKRHRIEMEMAEILADPPKEELIGSKPWMKRPWSEEGEE